MWYDRVVVGPVPWYWIVAIFVFTLAVVCGFVVCACNHKVQWRGIFSDLFMHKVHSEARKRDELRRGMANKKNFGPPKTLVHRFSKAKLRNSHLDPPRDPRVVIDDGHSVGSPSTSTADSPARAATPSGGKLMSIVSDGGLYNELSYANPDLFNGNSDVSVQYSSLPDDEPIEMTSYPIDCHLLSIDDNQTSGDRASLITAYSQEALIPAATESRKKKPFVRDAVEYNVISNSGWGGSGYEGYENRGATFDNEAGGSDLSLQHSPRPHNGLESVTLSSTSVSTSASTSRDKSLDVTLQSLPQLGRQGGKQGATAHDGRDLRTGSLTPTDATSPWQPSLQVPNQSAEPVTRIEVKTSPLPNDGVTASWASSTIKERPLSSRTKWSDETDSDLEDDVALDNLDSSTDTSESEPTEVKIRPALSQQR